MIRDFLKEHGSGFLLHIAGSVAIMVLGWWSGHALIALCVNTVLWPGREALQHSGKILTPHRILEWGSPLAVGFVIYAVLT